MNIGEHIRVDDIYQSTADKWVVITDLTQDSRGWTDGGTVFSVEPTQALAYESAGKLFGSDADYIVIACGGVGAGIVLDGVYIY